MRATYTPDDDKIRIYPESERLDSLLGDDEYAKFKESGYRWAAKQECFFAIWSPSAEDWAVDLAGEIDDEDYSPAERSADRAERFVGYRDRREGDAERLAGNLGDAAIGSQSAARAERLTARRERRRLGAVSMWARSEYWHERTRGVIAHAIHRERPEVRRSRIARLESEERKHLRELDEATTRYNLWRRVLCAEPGQCDRVLPEDRESWTAHEVLAYRLANSLCLRQVDHPRRPGVKCDPYSLLITDSDRLTPRELARVWLAGLDDPSAPGSRWSRWTDHYRLRLEYERTRLADEGGAATDLEIEAGGWLGSLQIQRVYRSPVTRKVTSVALIGPHPWKRNQDGTPKVGPRLVKLERMGSAAYRPPTDEERRQFADQKEEAASKRKPVPTINPTREDAERLQDILNRAAAAERQREGHGPRKPNVVSELTQGRFSQWLKYEYVSIRELSDGEAAVKLRFHREGMDEHGRASQSSLSPGTGRSWRRG